MNITRNSSLITRFALLIGALILLTALSSRGFYMRQERTDLELRLREKAVFLNNFYSYLISDALLRKDDVTLLQIINRLEEDKEITSVVVVDQGDEVRYHSDPEKMGTLYEDPWIKNVLKTGDAVMAPFENSGGRALAVVSPLKVQGTARPIGVVRMDLTFLAIEKQLNASAQRFWFMILGSIVSCTGLALLCLKRWILIPMQSLRESLASINTAMPEPNLPSAYGDLGQLYVAVNDLILRFKTEFQQQWGNQQHRGDQEKLWTQQLARSFMPDARIIIADKDNRIISDTANGFATAGRHQHLLDLIKDSNFANLLTSAFQKEGSVMKGTVDFQDQTYQASILSVPSHQSMAVKTLIALQPPH